MSVHANIAQVVGMDDRYNDTMAVMYELADEGDFASYAWGEKHVTVATLMR